MNAGATLRSALLAILLSAPLAAPPAGAGEALIAPFPVAETAALFSRWLAASGFEVERAPGEGGAWRLFGSRGEERWSIRLSPDSPLAARVDAERTVRGEAVPGAGSGLRAVLDAYGRENAVPPSGEDPSRVPGPVLARREAVVCIHARGRRSGVRFSGFLVDRNGLVLSTAHDLEGTEEFAVLLGNGEERRGRAVRRDPAKDLLLIDIGTGTGHSVPLDLGRNLLDAGERVYAIGCPADRSGTVNEGVVDGALRNSGGQYLWPVRMETRPGNSGGPVFDARGDPVGVVKGRLRGTETRGFVIPMGTVVDFLRQGSSR